MHKILKTTLAVGSFVMFSSIAMAQTDSTSSDGTAPVTEGSTDGTTTTDGSVTTDSTGAVVDPNAPASTSANEKPATRNKLYSGKNRGNNVIYDPKK